MGELSDNKKIVSIFYEMADLLEIKGVAFKPRAYRRAAQAIETLRGGIKAVYQRGELEEIPGIGSSMASKIKEFMETGNIESLEKLREEVPRDLRELMEIEGIGPKTALELHKQLGISNIEELESAAKNSRIRNLKGFGTKTEDMVLQGVRMYRSAKEKFLLGHALPIAEEIVEELEKLREVTKINLAGSIRRRKETIGDIDVLAASKEPLMVIDHFTRLPGVEKVLSKGTTKSSIVLAEGLQVDLRVVEEESFGSALQYFTGSKEHNIRLREIAIDRNWKLSEYGLIDKKTNERIAGENEGEIYKALGLNYIEPELRENRGEIEAASQGKLPHLVGYDEIKGDLHIHTDWSDGSHSIKTMADAAKSLGHEYLAICDHTKALRIAGGLSEEELHRQSVEIEKINRSMENFTILSGAEVNIDSSGKFDIADNVLMDLDIVVASIHSGFKQPEAKITERVLTAMHNDYVNVIGHPTGRIINRRGPYQIDLLKIFEAASEQGVLMEINAFPDRLDLSDLNCIRSKDYGVKVSIATDAHHKDQLEYVELGVATARRGWLEPKDVVNTYELGELKRLLNSR